MEIRERRTPPEELGPMLRAARERAGLGQREAARRAGVSQGHLWMLEAGQRVPSASVAEDLVEALALTPEESGQLRAAAVSDAGRSNPARSAA
ncbi:helix-turn-helix domain-containing protein [Streptomyces sp. 4N124]|uniref:helix-turn-helix domain-containing protein n=1 Tax=Streptomyces sp. 4N124 TaxID=3457420 RepID=UPI003FD0019C